MRRPQFSLKSLLWLMTASAIFAAILAGGLAWLRHIDAALNEHYRDAHQRAKRNEKARQTLPASQAPRSDRRATNSLITPNPLARIDRHGLDDA